MTTTQSLTRPAADIYEYDAAYEIYLDIPGVSEDAVEVELERDQLRVTGGPYQRRFTLGHGIDRENVQATVDKGVLALRLPKAADALPRKISVSRG
jgi:HSP20 family molecular chaperone IbpA